MIHYKLMRYIFVLLLSLPLLSMNLNAEYEMHIPNCTQKGVENCGGFLFDNETGDVLFCGSESCIDLKLPKSWKSKVKTANLASPGMLGNQDGSQHVPRDSQLSSLDTLHPQRQGSAANGQYPPKSRHHQIGRAQV